MVNIGRDRFEPVSLNPQWESFLHLKVNSFIKWDLVRFFHDNSHTVDTAENIGHFVGREIQTIQHELDDLVVSGVLFAEDQASIKIYRLTNDTTTRQLIAEFMQACQNRDFRVKAIQKVIHGMGGQHKNN